MEDTKRKLDRVLNVERDFEWSRFEGELMVLAYEPVLPVVRATSAGSPADPRQPDCDDQAKPTIQEWQYATGA